MAELVEKGLHFSERQESRLVFRRLGEVHHEAHLRTDVVALVVDPLSPELRHPGPALLPLAGMEVGIEHGQMAAVAVEDLIGLHFGMVDGDVLALLEGDAIEAGGETEHALDDILELEIGAQHLCVEVETLHLELVGIIAEVPRLKLEVVALQPLCQPLYLADLLDGSRFVGRN